MRKKRRYSATTGNNNNNNNTYYLIFISTLSVHCECSIAISFRTKHTERTQHSSAFWIYTKQRESDE